MGARLASEMGPRPYVQHEHVRQVVVREVVQENAQETGRPTAEAVEMTRAQFSLSVDPAGTGLHLKSEANCRIFPVGKFTTPSLVAIRKTVRRPSAAHHR
ncbi:unnamed protein product [Phaeothamnion confervicola]